VSREACHVCVPECRGLRCGGAGGRRALTPVYAMGGESHWVNKEPNRAVIDDDVIDVRRCGRAARSRVSVTSCLMCGCDMCQYR
jgi:hypothetical protein